MNNNLRISEKCNNLKSLGRINKFVDNDIATC